MSVPKRHHYLPQFYLRGFSRDGLLSIFDRDKIEFRVQTPVNTTVQKHYYSSRNEDGSLNPELELFLSQIEGDTAPIITKLNDGESLSLDEKHTFSLFMGLQINRIPDAKKRQEDMRHGILARFGNKVVPATEEEIAEASSLSPIDAAKTGVSAFELVQSLRKMESNPDLAHNDFLNMVVPVAVRISEKLFQMSWIIVHAPSESAFITTDRPFITLPPQNFNPNGLVGYGIATPGAVNLMPISSKSCLLTLGQGNGFGHINIEKKDVREINLNLSIASDRYLIAAEEQHARFLVKRSGIGKRNDESRIIVH